MFVFWLINLHNYYLFVCIVKHPCVGEVELGKIAVGKSELGKELLKQIPYAEILKTPSVWAVWIAAIGNFFCVNMMFLYSPVILVVISLHRTNVQIQMTKLQLYLHGVLHYAVRHTGFSASLAPLAQFSIKLLAGFTSDKVCVYLQCIDILCL